MQCFMVFGEDIPGDGGGSGVGVLVDLFCGRLCNSLAETPNISPGMGFWRFIFVGKCGRSWIF